MKFVFIVFTALLLGNNNTFAAATSEPDFSEYMSQIELISNFNKEEIVTPLHEALNDSLRYKRNIRQALGLKPVDYEGLDASGKITLETPIMTSTSPKTLKEFIDESSIESLRAITLFYLNRNLFDCFLSTFHYKEPNPFSLEPEAFDSYQYFANYEKMLIAKDHFKEKINIFIGLSDIKIQDEFVLSKRPIKLILSNPLEKDTKRILNKIYSCSSPDTKSDLYRHVVKEHAEDPDAQIPEDKMLSILLTLRIINCTENLSPILAKLPQESLTVLHNHLKRKLTATTIAIGKLKSQYRHQVPASKASSSSQSAPLPKKPALTISQKIALYEKHREGIKSLNILAPNFKEIAGQKLAEALSISHELKHNRHFYLRVFLPQYKGIDAHDMVTLDTPIQERNNPTDQTLHQFVASASPAILNIAVRFYTTRNLLDYFLNILYEEARKKIKTNSKKTPFSVESYHALYAQYGENIDTIKKSIYCYLDLKKLTNISDQTIFSRKMPLKLIVSSPTDYTRAKFALKNNMSIDEFSPETLNELYEHIARKQTMAQTLQELISVTGFLKTNLSDHIQPSKPDQQPVKRPTQRLTQRTVSKKKNAAKASSSSQPSHLIEYPTKEDVAQALPHLLTELKWIKSSRLGGATEIIPVSVDSLRDYIDATDLSVLNTATSQLRRRLHLEAWINALFDSQKSLISVRVEHDPLTFEREYAEYKMRLELLRIKLAEQLQILPLSPTPARTNTLKDKEYSFEWHCQVSYKLAAIANIQNIMNEGKFLKIAQQKRAALIKSENEFKNQRAKANFALLQKEEAEQKRMAAEQNRLKAEKQKAAEAEKKRIAAEREAEKKRIAAETKRIAQEKMAEQKRFSTEREAARKQAEAEQKRLAAEQEAARKQAEAERKSQEEAARRQAEIDRLAQEEAARRQAEAERLADEIAEQRAQEAREQAQRWASAPDFMPPPTHFVQPHRIVCDDYGRAFLVPLNPYYTYYYGQQ